MINAYELKIKIKYLTLAGYEDGEYQWMGESKDWSLVEQEINKYEN